MTLVELREDPVLFAHVNSLYDSMLKQNLQRLVEPYSCVEIAYIASLMEIPVDVVEKKYGCVLRAVILFPNVHLGLP